jgi:hypothetical protein
MKPRDPIAKRFIWNFPAPLNYFQNNSSAPDHRDAAALARRYVTLSFHIIGYA